MTCYQLNNGFLCMGGIDFKCPHCGKEYEDVNDKYLNKINRNKKLISSVRCECGNRFSICYDYKGNLRSFVAKIAYNCDNRSQKQTVQLK